MSNRTYRLVMGALLLVFLYFELDWGVFALIFVLCLEGFSNFLIPDFINLFRTAGRSSGCDESLSPFPNKSCFLFSAERAWRLVVALMLFLSFVLFSPHFNEYLQVFPQQWIEQFSYIIWFFPWFMGFAIFGAGISGVCPVLITVKWVGFK